MRTPTRKRVRRAILTCTRCHLSARAGVTPVPFRGPTPTRIAILGEAPGFDENTKGRPFVGASGRLLRDTLQENGIDIRECFVFNSVSCFPDGTPTVEERASCRIHVKRQLALAKPRWVLTLGRIALWHFDPDLMISTSRGKWWQSGDTIIFPTFHPAAALRDPERHERFIRDVARFARLVKADA